MHAYDSTKDDIAASYGRVHANGEQTHIAVLSCGDDHYVALAYDIDPVEFEGVAAEIVAYDPTLEGAVKRADSWMQQNAKGVADGGGGGGVLSKICGAAEKINNYGNDLADQQQQDEQ